MNFKCYLDGKEIKDQALLRQFTEDQICLFESLRVYNGIIFRFDEHLNRLAESAKSCGIQIPADSILKNAVESALNLSAEMESFIRLNFQGGKALVMIGARKHKPEIYQTGVDLKTSSFRMPSPGESNVQAKTGFYRTQLLTGKPEGAYDWLFLDENHFLTESRVGNFFMVKKGVVLTPPARFVLNGITRGVVIECARESGLLVQETPLTRHEAFNADEAFLTNTSWEILPVRSLDGRTVMGTVPGPVTKKLIQCFHRKVQIACQPKIKTLIPRLNARSSLFRTKKA